jgi:hypothetical protein
MKRLRLILAFGLVALASGVLGQAPALVPQSPFASPAAEGRGAESSAPELRGIVSGPDGTRYWICDASANSGAWLKVGEPGYPFMVQDGDPGAETATVAAEGRVCLLRLKAATVRPADAEASAGSPGADRAPAPAYMMTRRLPGEPRAPRAAPPP